MSIENISRKELYDIVAGTPQWRQLSEKNALDRANVEGFGKVFRWRQGPQYPSYITATNTERTLEKR
jgi:hypothetical protein